MKRLRLRTARVARIGACAKQTPQIRIGRPGLKRALIAFTRACDALWASASTRARPGQGPWTAAPQGRTIPRIQEISPSGQRQNGQPLTSGRHA